MWTRMWTRVCPVLSKGRVAFWPCVRQWCRGRRYLTPLADVGAN
ncbi:hypothetical protein [Desulfobacca acetoxidans]